VSKRLAAQPREAGAAGKRQECGAGGRQAEERAEERNEREREREAETERERERERERAREREGEREREKETAAPLRSEADDDAVGDHGRGGHQLKDGIPGQCAEQRRGRSGPEREGRVHGWRAGARAA
jgi:hypothetical protein